MWGGVKWGTGLPESPGLSVLTVVATHPWVRQGQPFARSTGADHLAQRHDIQTFRQPWGERGSWWLGWWLPRDWRGSGSQKWRRSRVQQSAAQGLGGAAGAPETVAAAGLMQQSHRPSRPQGTDDTTTEATRGKVSRPARTHKTANDSPKSGHLQLLEEYRDLHITPARQRGSILQ